jgi:hypothetical protein
MKNGILSPEQIEKLKEDFPPEALSKDNSRGFGLTSIKAAYVIERLNDVFGIDGWSYEYTPFETTPEGEVLTEVTLIIYTENIPCRIKNVGGHMMVKNRVADARKSAITDGLTKCASFLGIGHKVFKGLYNDTNPVPTRPPKSEPKTQPANPIPINPDRRDCWNKIMELCGNDQELARRTLQKHTSFTGKDGREFKGYTDITKVSDKAFNILYHKVKDAYEQKFADKTEPEPDGTEQYPADDDGQQGLFNQELMIKRGELADKLAKRYPTPARQKEYLSSRGVNTDISKLTLDEVYVALEDL